MPCPSSLRFSVCQVTPGGRRVIAGYSSVDLGALGMRRALTQDLDTGVLKLRLQETAVDHQVLV